MRHIFVAAALLAACHGSDHTTGGVGSGSSTTPSTVAVAPTPAAGSGSGSGSATPDAPTPAATPTPAAGSGSAVAAGSGSAAPAPTPAPAPAATPAPAPVADGVDFTPVARDLLAVGACADLPAPAGFPAELLAKHCAEVRKAQADYKEKWLAPATAFFAAHVPADVPKKVVYPFAGGDLSTALTVYPDADEITTMSLEPSGDPRDLATLKGKDLTAAMKKVAYELSFLYRVNFSNTINMIDAMRAGKLPTELIFALSAMYIHGYDVVALHYFRLNDDGTIHYLNDDDVAKAGDPQKVAPEKRNRVFANMEIQFRHGAAGRTQIYRHIQWNLDDEHNKADPRVMKYLEAKGPIAAMTKAASYLLSYDSFSVIRNYLLAHAQWMVSDATGIAPKWGKPAGFTYETYGGFQLSHIPSGKGISKDWRDEFAAEPKRDLPMRFGYYDKHSTNHLIIIKKTK